MSSAPNIEYVLIIMSDNRKVKTVLEEEKIFLIGDEGELRRLVK